MAELADRTVIFPGAPEQAAVRDQRHMIGARVHRTIAEVEEAWRAWGLAHGFPARRRFGDYSTDLRDSRKRVDAYVSDGNWTAACPGCNDGIACWPDHERGACLGCGTIYRVVYPAAGDVADALLALAARPQPNRHWFPDRETPADLRFQNIEHGFHPSKPLDEQAVDQLLAEQRTVEAFLEREGELGRRFLRNLGIPIGDLDPVDEIINRLTPEAIAGLVALAGTIAP